MISLAFHHDRIVAATAGKIHCFDAASGLKV